MIHIKNMVNATKHFVNKHRPEILIAVGTGGMLTSIVLAVKATPKAMQLLEEEKERQNTEKLTVVDTIKTTWKCYVPAATVALVSSACIVGGNNMQLKRSAALAAAYTISDNALKEYQSKVTSLVGEKKEKEIRDSIDADKVKSHPVDLNKVYITGKGETLCYESLTGRLFKSDIEAIRKSENNLSKQLFTEMSISLNDVFSELGLPTTDLGDMLGWRLDNGFFELNFSSQLTDDGIPCLVVNYTQMPTTTF